MNKPKVFLLALLFNFLQMESIYGQQSTASYQTLTMGYNSPVYRDFATSPLFYSGTGISLQTSWLKKSHKRERALDLNFNYSSMSADVPQSSYLQSSSFASFIQVNLRYLQLWDFKRFSNEKNNFKIGGNVLNTLNIRPNSGLFNNALGFENITNVMASVQFTGDISRKNERKIKLGMIKTVLKPKKRECRFQLNAGLLNLNSRPGYAFSYADELNGLETEAWILSDYRLSANGWRFNTELEFIKYLSIILPESWTRGLVKKSLNLTKRYDQTNPTQIHA
jgi:hypothetical protein